MVAARLVRQDAGSDGAAVDLEDVSHAFALAGGPLDVLDRVSLHIASGEFVALLGPSGCGKSTLLRLLAGLEPPTTGRIRFDGKPVLKPDPSRSLVFQDPTLLPWRTVQGNVAFGLEARGVLAQQGHRVAETLDLVGLTDFAAAFPHQLSGGMAQRAALARALVNEPRLFLMDEPLGKLDSLTRIALQKEILRLWRQSGFTAVLVTHDVEEALILAQRVVVFSERPARIQAIVSNDAPYPRHRDDAALIDRRRQILSLLGVEG